MSQPLVSCMCVTYGRTRWLREALQCFLLQTYPNRQLVILNTHPLQELEFQHPLVKVKNLPERPPSLGNARNICIDQSAGEWIVTWDDDNIELPRHIEVFMNHVKPGDQWVKMDKQWYAQKYGVHSVTGAECNLFAFTKHAWRESGKYPIQTVGEDQALNGKIMEKFPGTVTNLDAKDITHIYSWDNDVYHISGRPDWETAHSRIQEWVTKRMVRGDEPQGKVKLQPRLANDMPQQVEKRVAKLTAENQHHAEALNRSL